VSFFIKEIKEYDMKTSLKLLVLVWTVAVFSCELGNTADDSYMDPKVNISPLLSAIERGIIVVNTMDKTNYYYIPLKDLIETNKGRLADPDLYTDPVPTAQTNVNTWAEALHDLIDKVAPLPKPPEVTE
jgi:hypothetical protein